MGTGVDESKDVLLLSLISSTPVLTPIVSEDY